MLCSKHVGSSDSILERTMDMIIDNNEFGELMKGILPENYLHPFLQSSCTLKDLVKKGIPKHKEYISKENAKVILGILWNVLCVTDTPNVSVDKLLNIKPEGECRFFLYLCWNKYIVKHLYSNCGTLRLPKYYIPPVIHDHCGYIGEAAIDSYRNVSLQIDGASPVSAFPQYVEHITMMLLDNEVTRSDVILRLSLISKQSREACTIHTSNKIATMLFNCYRYSTQYLMKSEKSSERKRPIGMMESTMEERRAFDKIFEVKGSDLYNFLDAGTLPPYLNTIVSMICMKKFIKQFAAGECTRFDHMVTWDVWRRSTKFTKALCIYKWMKKLNDKVCMECGNQFDEYTHTNIGDDPVLVMFSISLNALNPRMSIPVFSCCSECCNSKDIVFMGDTFFYGMVPNATIERKDGTNVNLYLMSMLRFIKSTTAIIRRNVFIDKKKMTTKYGDLIGEMYTNEESYLEKIGLGVHTDKSRWLKDGIRLEVGTPTQEMSSENTTCYEGENFLKREMYETSSDWKGNTLSRSPSPYRIAPSFSSIKGYRSRPYDKRTNYSRNYTTQQTNIRSPREDVPYSRYSASPRWYVHHKSKIGKNLKKFTNKKKRKHKLSPEGEFVRANNLYKEICGDWDITNDSGFVSEEVDSDEEYASAELQNSSTDAIDVEDANGESPPVDIMGSL